MPHKIKWLQLENEIRTILRDSDFFADDALKCIDECLARHTGRGNEIYVSEEEYKRLEQQYPLFFDWDNV